MASLTPDFFSKFFRKRNLQRPVTVNISDDLIKCTSDVDEFDSIIVWDRPWKSFLFLVRLNVLFWLFYYLDFTLYGLIFIILLVLSIKQLLKDHFGSSATSDRVSDRESVASNSTSPGSRFESSGRVEMFKYAWMNLKQFRRDHPGMFFLALFIFFSNLFFIGRTVSGVTLAYAMLMTVCTVPGVCKHLVLPLIPPYILTSFLRLISHSPNGADSENSASINDKSDDESFRELMFDTDPDKLDEVTRVLNEMNESEEESSSVRFPVENTSEAAHCWKDLPNELATLFSVFQIFKKVITQGERENSFTPDAEKIEELPLTPTMPQPDVDEASLRSDLTFMPPEDDEGWTNFSSDSEFELEEDKERQEWNICPEYPRKYQTPLTNEDGRDVMFYHKKPSAVSGVRSMDLDIPSTLNHPSCHQTTSRNMHRKLSEEEPDREDSFSELTSDTESPEDLGRSEGLSGASKEMNSHFSLFNILAEAVISAVAPAQESVRHSRESSSDTDGFELITEEDI